MSKDIASGLEFLHGQKIVHRDLKPANILVQCSKSHIGHQLDVDIGDLNFKIGDFGLAKQLPKIYQGRGQSVSSYSSMSLVGKLVKNQ